MKLKKRLPALLLTVALLTGLLAVPAAAAGETAGSAADETVTSVTIAVQDAETGEEYSLSGAWTGEGNPQQGEILSFSAESGTKTDLIYVSSVAINGSEAVITGVDVSWLPDAVDGGECGGNLTWALKSDGTLFVMGTGDMYNWRSTCAQSFYTISGGDYASSFTPPWSDYIDQITGLVVLEGVTSIGEHAFGDCSSLVSVSLPDTVTSIGEAAFYKCSALESINLPEGLEKIRYCTFDGCDSLMSLTIPSTVTSITAPFGTFSSQNGFTVYPRDTKVTIYGYDNTTAEEWCTSNSSISTFVSLGQSPELTALLATQEEVIASGTFSTALTWTLTNHGTLTIGGTGDMGNWNATASEQIYSAIGSLGLYFNGVQYAPPWADYADQIRTIIIEDGVTTIGTCAFVGCEALTSVTIGSGVTTVSVSAFQDCTALESITIPDNVTEIGYRAFYGCTKLASVSLGSGVTTIGGSAFLNTALTGVTIPASVTSIEWRAFGWKHVSGTWKRIYDFTITGYTGSAAETYAGSNSITFVSLGTVLTSDSTGTAGGSSGSSTGSSGSTSGGSAASSGRSSSSSSASGSSGSSSSSSGSVSRYTDITSGSYYDA